MFVVRFVRKDKKGDELYFYQKIEDAQYHFELFRTDDSKLYREIHLISQNIEATNLLEKIYCR